MNAQALYDHRTVDHYSTKNLLLSEKNVYRVSVRGKENNSGQSFTVVVLNKNKLLNLPSTAVRTQMYALENEQRNNKLTKFSFGAD